MSSCQRPECFAAQPGRRLPSRLARYFTAEHRPFWLLIANGVIWRLSSEVFDPRRIVAAFLTQLLNREWVVGAALAIQPGVTSFPQLWESFQVSDGRRRMPCYRLGAWIRRTALASMILVVCLFAHRPVLLGTVFIILLGLMGLGEGLGSVGFGDIVTRTVPAHRRGRMFGCRMALGGLLAFGMGFLARVALAPGFALGFPYNYALLFSISLFFLFWAQQCFLWIDEPPLEPRERPAPTFWAYMRYAVAKIRRDPNMMQYLYYRCLTPAVGLPTAFIVPYAMKELHFHASVVGLFVSTSVLASVVANLAWAWVSDRRGNRLLLRLGIATVLAAVGLLAMTPFVGPSTVCGGWDPKLLWVLAVNCLAEAGLMAMGIGQLNYLYEIAPVSEVPLYTGLVSSATAPALIILPPLYGWLAQRYGYPVIFAVGLAAGVVCVINSLRLEEPRRR